jgi:type III secretory pathway component EscS
MVLGRLENSVVVGHVQVIVDPGTQLNQLQLVFKLRLLLVSAFLECWGHLRQLAENIFDDFD